jgi:peptidyl-prolyl cis-trans isomerase SurA
MQGFWRPITILLAALLAFAEVTLPAVGDNSIKVIVNDTPITSYDIAQRTALMALAGEKGGTKGAIDQLIDEALQMQEAARLGLNLSDAQVDAAFASIAGNMKLSTAQLVQALSGRGVAAATLKKRIKAQMAWAQLVRVRARRLAAIKPSDVTAALMAEAPNGSADKITQTEFTLQQILFVIPKGSSAAFVAQRKREAEAYRARFTGCEQSIALAKNLRDVVVKEIGRRNAADLTGPRGEEVRKTAPGKTTSAAQIDNGIELVAVCSTREIQSDAAARAQIESKLSLAQSSKVGDDYLKSLRDKAIIQNR